MILSAMKTSVRRAEGLRENPSRLVVCTFPSHMHMGRGFTAVNQGCPLLTKIDEVYLKHDAQRCLGGDA